MWKTTFCMLMHVENKILHVENNVLHIEWGKEKEEQSSPLTLPPPPRPELMSFLSSQAAKPELFQETQTELSCSRLVPAVRGEIRNPRHKHLSRNFFFDLAKLSSHIASEWGRVMTHQVVEIISAQMMWGPACLPWFSFDGNSRKKLLRTLIPLAWESSSILDLGEL